MPEQRFSKEIPKPIDEVWAAITAPRQPWYFDSAFAAELARDGEFRYENADGSVRYITGTVEEVVPPTRLVQRFRFTDLPDEPTRVTWLLTPAGDGTNVTIVHEFPAQTKTFRRTKRGWPFLLNNLHAFLTTGRLPVGARVQNMVIGPFVKVAQRLKRT
jgi:uncharacterized protein YndB with AHSA1/START domain